MPFGATECFILGHRITEFSNGLSRPLQRPIFTETYLFWFEYEANKLRKDALTRFKLTVAYSTIVVSLLLLYNWILDIKLSAYLGDPVLYIRWTVALLVVLSASCLFFCFSSLCQYLSKDIPELIRRTRFQTNTSEVFNSDKELENFYILCKLHQEVDAYRLEVLKQRGYLHKLDIEIMQSYVVPIEEIELYQNLIGSETALYIPYASADCESKK